MGLLDLISKAVDNGIKVKNEIERKQNVVKRRSDRDLQQMYKSARDYKEKIAIGLELQKRGLIKKE